MCTFPEKKHRIHKKSRCWKLVFDVLNARVLWKVKCLVPYLLWVNTSKRSITFFTRWRTVNANLIIQAIEGERNELWHRTSEPTGIKNFSRGTNSDTPGVSLSVRYTSTLGLVRNIFPTSVYPLTLVLQSRLPRQEIDTSIMYLNAHRYHKLMIRRSSTILRYRSANCPTAEHFDVITYLCECVLQAHQPDPINPGQCPYAVVPR